MPAQYKYLYSGRDLNYVRRGFVGNINRGAFKPYVYKNDDQGFVDNLQLDIINVDDYLYLGV